MYYVLSVYRMMVNMIVADMTATSTVLHGLYRQHDSYDCDSDITLLLVIVDSTSTFTRVSAINSISAVLLSHMGKNKHRAHNQEFR